MQIGPFPESYRDVVAVQVSKGWVSSLNAQLFMVRSRL